MTKTPLPRDPAVLECHQSFADRRSGLKKTTPQRRDLLDGFSRFNDVNANNVTARLRQPQRHPLAQPSITTSDDRNFTFERNALKS